MLQIGRLLRTVRHLRGEQIVWQLRNRLRQGRPAAPKAHAGLRLPTSPLSAFIPKAASWSDGDEFTFLNNSARLSDVGWAATGKSLLWAYNLHYFDWLGTSEAETRPERAVELIEEWRTQCPPGTAISWDAYPISLRLVNLAKYGLQQGALPDAIMASMAHQAQWLASNPERHLLANHLFANAKALIISAYVIDHPLSPRWLQSGLALFDREFDEQFLADGGHFERSPMYQALLLEDLLDLLNFMTGYDGSNDRIEPLREYASNAMRWLSAMSHGDGDISFFNDATFGIAPTPTEVANYARRLAIPIETVDESLLLPQTGYARLQKGDAVLLADIAPLGPDYQPGHGHADMLSCEFSLGTQRVIVNSGISEYGTGPERVRQRGTAAHSTLTIDDIDSAEIWSGFRVGRRGSAKIEHFSTDNVCGSHTGYEFLRGAPKHERNWHLREGSLEIHDTIENKGSHSATIRFHLHPSIQLVDSELVLPDERTIRFRSQFPVRIENSSWHPGFSKVLPSKVVTIDWPASLPDKHEFVLEWS